MIDSQNAPGAFAKARAFGVPGAGLLGFSSVLNRRDNKRWGLGLREPPRRIEVPVVVLLRMFALGMVAVLAACWALWRHYTLPKAPMVVPVEPHLIEIEPG
jgi:hypothetical protein